MRFPPEFIERLRNHAPISQVIGKRLPIKRHGREFHALCPFHKEKTPSFTINDEKGFFHCFGCAAHGDAIGFIKDYEGISYVEAVERLAGELGLEVPKMTREAQEYEQKRHTIEDTIALAAEWFREQLQSVAGQDARSYLEERGLSKMTVELFGIGYGGSREDLKAALAKRGITEAMMIEAGLLAKADDGITYNRFRGRLIFPIRSPQGKVVAFGGRLLPTTQSKSTAKYINSPETAIFRKGEMLFNYDIASSAARTAGDIIVTEGYMDVIALHQAGFKNAVAPLGTAITDAQLRLLWRVVPEPILCLDGDEAGKRAMKRAAALALPLLKPGISMKFATLPKGEDPDSLVRRSGVAAMKQVLASAKILSRVLWDNALADFGHETAEQKAALEQHLTSAANAIENGIVKQHMKDYFRDQIFALKRKKKFNINGLVDIRPDVLPAADDHSKPLLQLEEQVLALVILRPDMLHHADIEEYFAHMDFMQPVLDKLRSCALEICSAGQSVDHASLCAALSERGFSEKVETLLYSNSNILHAKLRNDVMGSLDFAVQAFKSAYSVYTDKKLEHEIRDAAAAFERDMSEQNQKRLFSLQKQRDELHRARYAVTSEE